MDTRLRLSSVLPAVLFFMGLSVSLPALALSKNVADTLPVSAQLAISSAIGKDQALYHLSTTPQGYRFNGPEQRYHVDLDQSGANIHFPEQPTIGLRLKQFGYGDKLVSLDAVAPQGKANRIEYVYPGISEWFVNGPAGIEQGFTLPQAPAGVLDPQQKLIITIRVVGARPEPGSSTDNVLLRAVSGEKAVSYGHLYAMDAHGRPLPAIMRAQAGSIVLEIDDAKAEYPVTIDPLIEAISLSADNSANDESNIHLGASVDADGQFVVVGLPGSSVAGHQEQGRAYVFQYEYSAYGSYYYLYTTLTATDGGENDHFGASVSISDDVIFVGAPDWDMPLGGWVLLDVGAVYQFDKPAEGWLSYGLSNPVAHSGGSAADHFGASLDNKGDRLVVGAPGEDSGKGRVYAFESTNVQECKASDGAGGDGYGSAVSLYYNPSPPSGFSWSIAVGAPGRSGGGAVYMHEFAFFQPNSALIEYQKVQASALDSDARFGTSVSIQQEWLVAGAPDQTINSISDAGAVYAFSRVGMLPTWTQVAQLSRGSLSPAGGHLGKAVTLNEGTDIIVAGAPGADNNVGQLAVFRQPLGGWTTVSIADAVLIAQNPAGAPQLGQAVAMGNDASETFVVAGAPEEPLGAQPGLGKVYVFESNGGAWTGNMNEVVSRYYDAGYHPEDDQFGHAIAMNDQFVVVGAPNHNSDGYVDRGAVYVYEKPDLGWDSGWANMAQTHKLLAAEGKANDRFGYSVAVSNETIVIGAPNADNYQGAVYVFEKECLFGGGCIFAQKAKLTAQHASLFDALGESVAIDGDMLVAGAPGYMAHLVVDDAGSAFVYKKPDAGWVDATQTVGLYAFDSAASSEFGRSVDISGHTVVVGAAEIDSYMGAAYLFVEPESGWDIHWSDTPEDAKLTATDAISGSRLATDVAISGDTVVASAPYSPSGSSYEPGLYVYEKPEAGWPANMTETLKLKQARYTGLRIDLNENLLAANYQVAGAQHQYTYGVRLFQRAGSGWSVVGEYSKSRPYYWYSGEKDVALNGDYVAYGPRDDSREHQLAIYPDQAYVKLLKLEEVFSWELFLPAINAAAKYR